jgi:DNA-binding SARP family transcriptional activator
VEYRLLGPLELIDDEGQVVGLPAGKPRALLALLLLEAGQPVSVDRIVDGLWGERAPATAANAVRGYVARLRKLLPDGVLETAGTGYSFRIEAGELDLDRFELLYREGAAAAVDGLWQESAALLGQALALWRGSALVDFRHASFALVEAARLEDLRVAALEERVEADLELGRESELIGELVALVKQHPHRERLRGLLMLALYRSGRQAEALAAYHDARAALDELGLEPGAALKQLERQILAHDAALDRRRRRPPSAAVARPGALVPASPFPFIGRERELTVLRTLLERAERGEGGLVLLGGEAGAGKTRLVRELAHEATDRGVLVLYGASDAAVSTPYEPPRAWLEFLLRIADRASLVEWLGERGEMLTRLVPELESLTGIPAPPPRDPVEYRYLLQSALGELLRRVSKTHPVLLVADDVHWADGETLRALRRLARIAPEARLLVFAVYRDRGEEPEPAFFDTLADLSRLDGVTRMTLGNLSNREVGEFIRGTAGVDVEPGLAAAVGALTEGTPLLLCELWRDLGEQGALDITDEGGVRLTYPLADLHCPERVRDLVQHRLARLAPDVTRTLEHAAVLGARFQLRVLTAATELEPTEVATALERASLSGIVEELLEPEPSYGFTHELIRRAVYDRIPAVRRARLHLHAGKALERLHAAGTGRPLPELAHHFTLAAPVAGREKAIDYNLRAAEAAISAAAYGEAAARLQSALALGIDDPRERARIQVELGFLLNETGRIAESESILAASVEVAADLEEGAIATRGSLARALHRAFADSVLDVRELEPGAKQAIETLGQLRDSAGVSEARRLLAVCRWRQGHAAEAWEELERALLDADASHDWYALRRVVTSIGGLLCDGPVPVGEAVRRCEALLRTYGGDLVMEGVITRCLSLLYAMAGRFDEARAHLERSSVLLDDLGLLTQSWVYRRLAAETKRLLGDRAGEEHELKERWRSLRNVTEAGPDGRAMHAAYMLALWCVGQGRWEEAAEHLSYGRNVLDPPFFRAEFVLRFVARARLAAHRGESAEALELARRAIELVDRTDFLNLRALTRVSLAAVQRSAGLYAEADAAVADAVANYVAKGNVSDAAPLRLMRAAAG